MSPLARARPARIAAVLAASLAVSCTSQPLHGAGLPAGDKWPPLPREAVAYLHEDLERDTLASLGVGDEEMGFSPPVTDITLGEPAPLYHLDHEFVRGEAPADRRSAFRHTGEWAVPVSQQRSIRTVVTFGRLGKSWQRIGLGYGLDLAAALAAVRPGDLLVFDGPVDSWFLVRGDTVTELGSRGLLDATVSLRRFRQLLVAEYRSFIPLGTDETTERVPDSPAG